MSLRGSSRAEAPNEVRGQVRELDEAISPGPVRSACPITWGMNGHTATVQMHSDQWLDSDSYHVADSGVGSLHQPANGSVGLPAGKVNYETCIACKACAKACPSNAMDGILRRKKTIPDCFSCSTCIKVCPTNSIKFDAGRRDVPQKDKFG